MRLLSAAFAFILVISCSKSDQTFELNETVSIPFGKTAKLNDGDKPIFKFTKLIEESRCPEGTNCIWAGRVLIELTIDDDQTHQLGLGDLETGDNSIEETADFGNYEIQLIDASFGAESDYAKEEKYTVKIKVLPKS